MAVAQFPVMKANGVVEFIYFVVAGLAWILPAMPLIRWMGGRTNLRRVDAAEAVPHRGRSPGHEHAHIAHLLVLAVERDARQRDEMTDDANRTARRGAS